MERAIYDFGFFMHQHDRYPSALRNETSSDGYCALDVNGVEARRYTATRATADVGETVEIGDAALYMLDGQISSRPVAPGASSSKVRVRNASGSGSVWVGGLLAIR